MLQCPASAFSDRASNLYAEIVHDSLNSLMARHEFRQVQGQSMPSAHLDDVQMDFSFPAPDFHLHLRLIAVEVDLA